MGTTYNLIEKNRQHLELDEHSNLFDACITEYFHDDYNNATVNSIEITNLTLEDLKKINQKLTNIISYFEPDYEGVKVDYMKGRE